MGTPLPVRHRAYRHPLASQPRPLNQSAHEVVCSDATTGAHIVRIHALSLDLPRVLYQYHDVVDMRVFVTSIILLLRSIRNFRVSLYQGRWETE